MYTNYLKNWYILNTKQTLTNKEKIKDEYLQLVKDITYLFTEEEKNRFLKDIDYTNPAVWNDAKNYPLTLRKEIEEKTYDLRKRGLLVNKGNMVQWKTDFYGNEYGLFKDDPIPNSPTTTTTTTTPCPFLACERLAVSVSVTPCGTWSIICDGNDNGSVENRPCSTSGPVTVNGITTYQTSCAYSASNAGGQTLSVIITRVDGPACASVPNSEIGSVYITKFTSCGTFTPVAGVGPGTYSLSASSCENTILDPCEQPYYPCAG